MSGKEVRIYRTAMMGGSLSHHPCDEFDDLLKYLEVDEDDRAGITAIVLTVENVDFE